ncbi:MULTISPECIES: response regulator transcription factor [Anaerococcus]|uniref:response regulator transcription factor n=1 Tax=Anaerococcus TaxID=165779 RepID=UPI001AE2C18B|nr:MULTISPECIES: response regulator transcription factor [Anaerococcus]MBP2069121.1 DNA-binding response OmpR family regulator [Anaerococcus nagyae]MDU3210933.1 response regulator transcription factor [Anaerococcus sp.]
MNILLIDDDIDLTNLIKNTLKKEYDLTIYNDSSIIDPDIFSNFDLIILDIMMPKMSGFEFLEKYRNMIDIPILLLTAKDFEADKIEGFALGADDYITKPFSINELRARVAAHIRRERREKHNRLVDYPISCDLLNRKFYTYENEINLTKSEYEICVLLLKNKGQVFSKEYIYTTIYGYDADGDSKSSITERIKQIRSKFVEHKLDPIKTVWGVGYKWEIENL